MRITISDDNDDYVYSHGPSSSSAIERAHRPLFSSESSKSFNIDFHSSTQSSFSTDDKQSERLLTTSADHHHHVQSAKRSLPFIAADPALSEPPLPTLYNHHHHNLPVPDPVHDKSTSTTVIESKSHSSSRSDTSSSSSTRSSTDTDSDYSYTQITPLNTIQYVHGGYAAAAPMFITNEKWMLILRHLMPEAHANLMSLLMGRRHSQADVTGMMTSMTSMTSMTASGSPSKSGYNEGGNNVAVGNSTSPSSNHSNTGSGGMNTSTINNNTNSNHSSSITSVSTTGGGDNTSRIIKWAENNPIVTAYGCLYSKENQTKHQIQKLHLQQSSKQKKNLYVQQEQAYNISSINPSGSTIQHDNRSKSRSRSRRRDSSDTSYMTTSSTPPYYMPPNDWKEEGDNSQQKQQQSQRRQPQPQHFNFREGHATKQNTKHHNPQKPIPAIEWDVFLDPTLVKHVDGAIQYLENLTKTNTLSNGILVDHQTIQKAKTEVNKQVSRLISRMVLAHGSTTQLAIEAAGVASAYNFKQVLRGGKVLGKKTIHDLENHVRDLGKGLRRRSRNSRSRSHGRNKESKYIRTEGIFVDEWLSLFAEGLQMGQKSDQDIKAMMGIRTPSMKQRHFSDDETVSAINNKDQTGGTKPSNSKIHDPFLCGLLLCLGFSEPLAATTETFDIEMLESARKISSLLGDDLRIILDLKSRRVPPRVWARLIDTLNSKRLVVEGIGSFDLDEVRRIEDIVSSPLCRIMFFHSAGDLQRACHENKVSYNLRHLSGFFLIGSFFVQELHRLMMKESISL